MEWNEIPSKVHKRKMSNPDELDIVGKLKTSKSVPILHHCQACSSNQYTNEDHVTSSVVARSNKLSKRKHNMGIRFVNGFPVWSVLFLAWMNFFVVLTQGLQCYECLSLHCESGAVCDAIKSTMLEIFFPKRHFIHFDPNDVCPEKELPLNSDRWANLSKACERSDSICLISPIEVHSVVDGKKDGRQLEKEYTLITNGYVLGCASRRILLDFPETINVRVELEGRNESGKSTSSGSNIPSGNGSNGKQKIGGESTGNSEQRGNNGGKKQKQLLYNLANAGNGAAQFDPTKKIYKDKYNISKIYHHVFYIDQGTQNATRCIEDNCNDKVKFRLDGNSTSSSTAETFSWISRIYVIFTAVFIVLQN